MAMIRFVFFDVANTLLYKPLLLDNIHSVLRRHGVDVDKNELALRHKLLAEIIKFPDKTSREFYLEFNKELLRTCGVIATEELAEQVFEKCKYLPWEPFEDCTYLKNLNIPKGIISNWDNQLHQRLELLAPLQFDPIIGSMESGFAKPSQKLFSMAIDKAGFDAGEICYVGDSIKLDIEPAAIAGMKTILIDRLNAFKNYQGRRLQSFSGLTGSYLEQLN